MALYVSLTNWQGNGSPFTGGEGARFVGAQNYTDLFTRDGLTRSNFMQSIGNTFCYVLLVVPLRSHCSSTTRCWGPRASSARPSTSPR